MVDHEAIDQWIRDHAYDPDDIVLGDGITYGHIVADVQELLDLARPGWRELFRR